MLKRLGGIIGCKDKTSSWHSTGFPSGSNMGQQYDVGEKPTVILYTYINPHAGTPKKTETNKNIVVHTTTKTNQRLLLGFCCSSHFVYWLPSRKNKTTLHGGQSRSWSVEQGKETKAQRTQKFTDRRGGGGTTSPSREDRGTPSAEDVERRKHLDEAEVKVGTVESMCPEGERRRRIDHNGLDILETEHRGLYMSHHRDGAPKRLIKADDLVKRHMRAAAGTDISKPELLRTPLWLARTVDHLVLHCMDKGPQGGGDPAFAWQDPRIQSFMAQRDEPLQVVEDEASRDVSDGFVFYASIERNVDASTSSESAWILSICLEYVRNKSTRGRDGLKNNV